MQRSPFGSLVVQSFLIIYLTFGCTIKEEPKNYRGKFKVDRNASEIDPATGPVAAENIVPAYANLELAPACTRKQVNQTILIRNRSSKGDIYICNSQKWILVSVKGADGDDGVDGAAIVSIVKTEAPGCEEGGVTVLSFRDDDLSGSLNSNEKIIATNEICHGDAGSKGDQGDQGDQGEAGFDTLMRQSSEPAGANCLAGGIKTASGLDQNRDQILAANEISQVSYLCLATEDPLFYAAFPGVETDGTNIVELAILNGNGSIKNSALLTLAGAPQKLARHHLTGQIFSVTNDGLYAHTADGGGTAIADSPENIRSLTVDGKNHRVYVSADKDDIAIVAYYSIIDASWIEVGAFPAIKAMVYHANTHEIIVAASDTAQSNRLEIFGAENFALAKIPKRSIDLMSPLDFLSGNDINFADLYLANNEVYHLAFAKDFDANNFAFFQPTLARVDLESGEVTTVDVAPNPTQVFRSYIQDGIKNSCVGCHAATPINGSLLSAKNANTNRKILAPIIDCDADGFLDFLFGATHPGAGGLSAEQRASAERLQSWLDVEAACAIAPSLSRGPLTRLSADSNVWTFVVAEGVGIGAWNDSSSRIEMYQGETLRILFDDSSSDHALHTLGQPCSHGGTRQYDANGQRIQYNGTRPMLKGMSLECDINISRDYLVGELSIYDHFTDGAIFANFYLTVPTD